MIRLATRIAGAVWSDYAEAIGPVKMHEFFGSRWPPAEARPGEHVWVWRHESGMPFAWLSLTVDQLDPAVIHMSRGVWPTAHGRGVGRQVRAFAIEKAQELGGQSLCIVVHIQNVQHLANVVRDPFWKFDGVTLGPPALMFAHAL
jgi:GNAT superfamily N-acetyltransferase